MTKPRLRDVLPLSPLQEGMLFHAQFDSSGADVYAVQLVLDLEGDLDASALRRAGDALLARHPNLGAAFRHRKSGEPVQLIPEPMPLPWREHDLSELPAQRRRAALEELVDADRATRFDLSRPPLVRATLVRSGPAENRLILTIHHIVADGWSMPILARELFTLYADGDARSLPSVTPYREYQVWLAQQDRGRALDAWRGVLAGVTEATMLAPTERRHTPVLPQQVTGELSEADTARLTTWARSCGLTLNSVVQGAWAMLLGGLTGRTDVLFGMVTSGRPADVPGIESMIGFFINTLPVRVALNPAATVRQTIAAVQRTQVSLMPHGYLGLGELQQLANIGELFDTVIVFENYPMAATEFAGIAPGLRLAAGQGRDANHYPVTLLVMPGDRLGLRIDYRPDGLDAARSRHILDQLVELLCRMPDDHAEPLARFALLTPAERREITARNSTDHAVPAATLSQLVEAQTARTPHAPAITDADGTLTYSELDRRANQLARHLIGRGLGPDQLAAVALEPSSRLVVALLAVLKTGAGYVPLDATHPADRISYVLANSRASLVLTEGTSLSGVDSAAAAAVHLDTRETADAIAHEDAHPIVETERARPTHPRDGAYVIYTSGSTGRPKGVLIEQRSAVNYLAYASHAYPSVAKDALLHSSVTFDLTVTTLFAPLVSGGHIVVADLVAGTVASEPGSTPGAGSCGFLKATPSHLRLLADAPERLSPTGELVVGGEQLLGESLDQWRHCHPAATVINEYGPTEATVGCVVHTIEPGDPTPSGAIPIGRPIWNARVHLLDPMLRPVPDGVTGELYLSGVCLARGYVNQPGLTAERFVANPFSAEPGDRMYRTGDLARWSRTHELEYQGRTDDQVKVRGYRIELGEIEAALVSHPAVEQAAVTVITDSVGENRIAAYLAPASCVAGTGVQVLRKHLVSMVPDYMLPNSFVGLDHLPLTSNGKVDRAALPMPGRAPVGGAPPRDEREKRLCGLFSEVLGVPSIGIDDDFFNFGGQSLLAMRLAGRIRADFGVDLPIRALFEAPTVAELSARLVELAGSDSFATLIPLRRGGDRPPIFCMHPGGGVSWFYRGLAPHLGPEIPLYGLQARGISETAELPASLADMAAEYIEQMRVVQPVGPYYLLGWSFGGVLAYEVAAQLQRCGERVDLLVSLDGGPAGPDEELPDDRGILEQIVTYLGYDPGELLSEGFVLADLVSRFRRDEHVLSTVTERQLANLIAVAHNNAVLRRDYRPSGYSGKLVYVQAADTPQTGADSWRAHVRGPIDRHDVDCAHDFMLAAESSVHIGRIISAELSHLRDDERGSR